MTYKSKFLSLGYVCLTAALSWGQSGAAITGIVQDPQRAGIPSASLTLIARDGSTRLSTTTDGKGEYRFERVAPGAYLLEAGARGFVSSTPRAIQMEKEARLQVDLMLQVAGLATHVVVTATGTPQTTDELSKALSVVDKEEIDTRDTNSIADTLDGIPGLRVQQLGGPGGLTSIKTRGLRNEDTAVLIDGFRLRDAATTQGDASALLEDLIVTNVDRIEVLRGAGSSIYGSNATGGVVNVISGTGTDQTRRSVLLEGGSLDTFRGRAEISGTLGRHNLHYSLGASHLNVMSGVNGDSPDRVSSLQGCMDYAFSPKVRLFGRVFASDSFSKLLNSPQAIGVLSPDGAVNALPLANSELRRYEDGTPISQLNLSGATFIPASDNPDSTRAARIFSGALSLSIHPTDSLGITTNYQGLVTRRHFGDGPAGPGYQPDGSTLSFYDGEIHTASTRVDWRLGRYQSIDAGYEFEDENYGNRSLVPNPADNAAVAVTQRSSAIFAQDQLHFLDGRLQFAASFRAQMFSLDHPQLTPPSSAPYSNMIFAAPPAAQTGDASAAYFFRNTGTKLRAHAGKGYRAASLYERFGTYYGAWGYSAYGDPGLRPDRSIAVDGGVDQALWNGRARLSATYFYTRLQEVITFDTSGAITPSTDPYGRYGGYRNTNGGLARGVEFGASLTPTRTLTLNGAYTFTDARQRSPLVPGVLQTYVIPDHSVFFAATERLSSRWTLIFDLHASSRYLAPIYDPITYSSRAYQFRGMARAQAGASYRVPLGESRALRFFAKVDNLFNQTYFESGYRMPGVTAQAGTQFEF